MNWDTGQQSVPRAKARGRAPARASPSSPNTSKGYHDQGFDKGWGKKDDKGFGTNTFSQGKGKYGKGLMERDVYTVMEEEDWNQWSGYVEQEGEGALALFNLTGGLAGRGSTAFSPSGEPVRVDLCDFVMPQKGFAPKCSRRLRNPRNFHHTGTKSLGCLLEDVKVSDEEQQDGSTLENSSDMMSSPTSSLKTNKREGKLQSWNFAHICTAAEKCKDSRTTCCASLDSAGNGMMRKTDTEINSKIYKASVHEIHEKELCWLFEVDNTLCHLNDRWVKIEAVMDSGAAESVALADMAPCVPMLESSVPNRGQTYMSVCGEKLPNLGQKQLKVWTNEGTLAVATFQCADVAASQTSPIREIELSSKVKAASSRVGTDRVRISRGSTVCTFWRCTRKSRVSRGRVSAWPSK